MKWPKGETETDSVRNPIKRAASCFVTRYLVRTFVFLGVTFKEHVPTCLSLFASEYRLSQTKCHFCKISF